MTHNAENDALRERLRKDVEASASRPAHEKRHMPAISKAPATKVTHMGLTHDCDDPECHVAGFVKTLALHMSAELAPAHQGAYSLRLAAEAFEGQPPKLRSQYVAALRLYAEEPWRLTSREREA